MKLSRIENGVWTTRVSMQNSLNGVSKLFKKFVMRAHVHEGVTSYWQLILLQSKVNGCFNHDVDLPQNNWGWPKNTWFQKRLNHQLHLEFGHSEGELDGERRRAPES